VVALLTRDSESVPCPGFRSLDPPEGEKRLPSWSTRNDMRIASIVVATIRAAAAKTRR
jgi:hypothetical protein